MKINIQHFSVKLIPKSSHLPLSLREHNCILFSFSFRWTKEFQVIHLFNSYVWIRKFKARKKKKKKKRKTWKTEHRARFLPATSSEIIFHLQKCSAPSSQYFSSLHTYMRFIRTVYMCRDSSHNAIGLQLGSFTSSLIAHSGLTSAYRHIRVGFGFAHRECWNGPSAHIYPQ